MLTVARVTFKRLIRDRSVFIALFIVPVIIIFVFSKMSAVPADEEIKYRVGILKESESILTEGQKNHFNWVYFESEEAMKNSVLRGTIASGILFEEGKIKEVLVTHESFGYYIMYAFEHKILEGEEKVSREDKSSQIKVILNFLINYMLFSMIFIATDMTQLKNLNILKRMESMPLSSLEVFSGLLFAFASLLTLQILQINFVIYSVVGVPISENLLLSTLVFLLMSGVILSLGLLVTRFTENSSVIPIVCNLIAIPLMMISGTFMPVDHHPLLSKVKFLSPQYWVVDAVGQLNQGQTQVYLHLAVLFTMALMIFSVAIAGRKLSLEA